MSVRTASSALARDGRAGLTGADRWSARCLSLATLLILIPWFGMVLTAEMPPHFPKSLRARGSRPLRHHQHVERLPRLGHVMDAGRHLVEPLARISGGEDHREVGPAHLDLAGKVDPV